MPRVTGGRQIPPEGMDLFVVCDEKGAFLSERTTPQCEQFIPSGALLECKGRRGRYGILCCGDEYKDREPVIVFDTGEVIRISQLALSVKVRVFRPKNTQCL